MSEFDFVISFYKDDFHPDLLHLLLALLLRDLKMKNAVRGIVTCLQFFFLKEYFCALTAAKRDLLSQVCSVVRLILVMPATATNATLSFSALRRVKSFLRSSKCQERLHNLMVLHVHKDDLLENLNIDVEFSENCSHGYKL